MKMLLSALAAAGALSLAGAASAATLYKVDVTVTSLAGVGFSAPFFTFTNLSSAGVQVGGVTVSGGPPWDYVLNFAAPYHVQNPAGGTRTITVNEESTGTDFNNGGPTAISYNLTSFDPGDVFRFAADPEAPGGGSAVVDIRPAYLTADVLGIAVAFVGGPTLSGSDWTLEYVDPMGDLQADSNQVYRMTLEQRIGDPVGGIPEPAAWALMIAGFGLAGGRLRSRRQRVAA